MPGLAPTTQSHLYAHLAGLFGLPAERLSKVGTTALQDETRDPAGHQVLWTLDAHSVIRVHPSHAAHIAAILSKHPADHRLTLGDLRDDTPRLDIAAQDYFYTVDANTLVSKPPAAGFDIRQIDDENGAAFAAFLAACSAEDKSQGQISLEDEVVFAAFEGERLAAAGSTFEWLGFVDVGVLTHPDYRGRGLGSACVAAVADHYMSKADDTRLMLYRHELTNLGSAGVARSVGFQRFAAVDYVRFSV